MQFFITCSSYDNGSLLWYFLDTGDTSTDEEHVHVRRGLVGKRGADLRPARSAEGFVTPAEVTYQMEKPIIDAVSQATRTSCLECRYHSLYIFRTV